MLQHYSQETTRRSWIAIGLVLLLLVIDQTIKYLVKTNMMLNESIHITDWFYILFTENPGMAFGWEVFSKSLLTLFRLVASIAISVLIYRLVTRHSYSIGLLLCVSTIFAGAVGNIIDSIFYGVLFDHSVGQVATFLPEGGGYASLLHGKVVDMFYFPLIKTTWPAWVPIVGGESFIFFRPIFNFADACISVGLILLIIFYAKPFCHLAESFSHQKKEAPTPPHKG